MPPKNFCRKSEAVGEIPRFFPIKPVNVLVAAQPCKLTLGILARAELDLFDGFLAEMTMEATLRNLTSLPTKISALL